MTPVDHRRPRARVARRQQKSAARRDDAPPRRPRKVQRSHSAVGAAIVAAAALVAVFGFILTNGSSSAPTDDGLRLGDVPAGGAAAPAAPAAGDDASTTKADRKPPATSAAPKAAPRTSAPPVNTGADSPAFKRGQWIVQIDKYPTDAGMDADQVAKALAARLIKAGIPAKAMLVNGQYPGIANSSMEPVTNTWLVYLGPGTSSEQMLNLCSAPKTQSAYQSSACPTYEPAVAPGH